MLLNRKALTRFFANARDNNIKVRMYASCLVFHFDLKYRWKGKSYPRSLLQDMRAIADLLSTPTSLSKGSAVNTLFIPVSDPCGITWDECADAIVAHALPPDDSSFFVNRYLWVGVRFFLINVFAAYLKRSGDLQSAIELYQKLILYHYSPYEGNMGLADIHHLLANWRLELEEYKRYGARSREIAYSVSRDMLWNLQEYDHYKAISYYNAALAIRPGDGFALQQKGRCLLDAGETQNGALTLAMGARLQPRNSMFQIRSAAAGVLARRRGAILHLKRVLYRHPILNERFGTVRRVTIVPAASLPLECVVERSPSVLGHLKYQIVDKNGVRDLVSNSTFIETVSILPNRSRDIGLGCIVIDDKYLVKESKHVGVRSLKMFAPSILINDEKSAVIGCGKWATPISTKHTFSAPGASFNYFHFLFETLAALISYEEQYGLEGRTFLVPRPLAKFQLELMELALNSKPKVVVDDDAISARTALYCTRLGLPARFSIPHPDAVRAIRKRISRHFDTHKSGKRVYLTRRSVSLGRKNVNEEEVERLLHGEGIVPCDTGKMSIAEQIEYFKDVELVVAPQGAALSNLVFCPSTTTIIGIGSMNHHFECFTSIASNIGQKYILAASDAQTIPNAFFAWSTFNMRIDLKTLRSALRLANSV